MKHQHAIKPDNFVASTMSSLSFFSRYPKGNIVGLTGTTGTPTLEWPFLQEQFDMGVVVIPPHRTKRYRQLAPRVTNGWKGHFAPIRLPCLTSSSMLPSWSYSAILESPREPG